MFYLLAQAAETVAENTEQATELAQPTLADQVSQIYSQDTGLNTEALMAVLMPVAWVLIILVVAYFLAVIVNRSVTGGLRKARVDETLARFFGRFARTAILIIAVIMCLDKFGVSTTSLAAVIAAAGFAVGLAFQGSLSNFSAGVMLLVFRPFKVGHVVNVAGVLGKVNEIELFTTTIDTFDNRRLILPNSSIFGTTIENISFHNDRRVDVAVGVEYSADIDKTRATLEKAAQSIAGVIQGEGRGYQVVLGDLGDSAVGWTVRIWVNAADYWPQKEALTRAIKMHLDEAGIGIPFPQLDVHLQQSKSE